MRTQEELKAAWEQVEDIRKSGALEWEYYCECLVTLASEYVCDHHDLESGLILLNTCPQEFFDFVLPKRMAQDQALASAAISLSFRLIQLGIFDLDPDEPNVPGANA